MTQQLCEWCPRKLVEALNDIYADPGEGRLVQNCSLNTCLYSERYIPHTPAGN